MTPDLTVKTRSIYVNHARNRGAEIQAWLGANGNPERFVILDVDDDDMGRLDDTSKQRWPSCRVPRAPLRGLRRSLPRPHHYTHVEFHAAAPLHRVALLV